MKIENKNRIIAKKQKGLIAKWSYSVVLEIRMDS